MKMVELEKKKNTNKDDKSPNIRFVDMFKDKYKTKFSTNNPNRFTTTDGANTHKEMMIMKKRKYENKSIIKLRNLVAKHFLTCKLEDLE